MPFLLKAIVKRLGRMVRPPKPRHARGVIDRVVNGIAIGWAIRIDAPDRPLRVRLVADGIQLFEAVATDKREDVAAAGLGTALCGFQLPLPHGFEIHEGTKLELINAETDAPICHYVCTAADRETAPSRPRPAPAPGRIEATPRVEGLVTIQWPGDASTPGRTLHARVVPVESAPRIRGVIEGVSSRVVRGWAYDTAQVDRPVVLDLYIDGILYESLKTSIARTDVQARYGCHRKVGFIFELPRNLEIDVPVAIEIRSPVGEIEWRGAALTMRPVPNAKRAPPAVNRRPLFRPLRVEQTLAGTAALPSIALVVLNRNGARLLEPFLRSFALHASHRRAEILIVDHGSTDDSETVAAAHADQLWIRWLPRGENFSFSASNNWAARHTDADVLIFANNDLEFGEDVVGAVAEIMTDPSIGLLGMHLLDKPTRERALGGSDTQHLGVFFESRARTRAVLAFDSRHVSQLAGALSGVTEVPAVTAAFAAMRRADFLALGGFDEAYFYGNEDVDLCLKVQAVLRKKVAIASHLRVVHHRGYTRTDPELKVGAAYQSNWETIDRRFGYWLKIRSAQDLVARPGFWTSTYPKVAFAVTDARDNASAGDYFTALELAKALQERWACKAVFLDKQRDWFDLEGVDILIVMRDDYDLTRIRQPSPQLVKIGWARNWIDRWAQRPWAEDYDQYWASSTRAAAHLRDRLARPVPTVAIATDPEVFAAGTYSSSLASDYCFTGSYWGVDREITELLDPDALPEYRFALVGYGWEQHPTFAAYARGGLPYSRMRDVYASTRIVIDDANSATKRWGSVNSRVFDAIAAGALVVTNGDVGANEAFDGLLPTYSGRQQLTDILRHYLSDEPARRELVGRLKEIVVRRHTYAHRAASVVAGLETLLRQQRRISIKIGAPNEAVREEWGDWHFAVALRRAFTRQGHACRIDCLDRWDTPEGLGDHAVIVLRGLSRYTPKSHQINLMWNISHPDKIEDSEYESYDHVFVASASHASILSARLNRPVSPLLQCTDPERFHPDVPPGDTSHEVLFVGNSRKVRRQIVADAIDAGLPLTVFGSRWQGLIPDEYIAGEHVSNDTLASLYRDAGVVLNDHWDTMRDAGFLSNRLFDAVACGARVISDRVESLDEVFENFVATYDSPESLRDAVLALSTESSARQEERRSFARRIAALHSFDARAAEILLVIEAQHARRMKADGAQGAAFHPDTEESPSRAIAA